MMLLLAACVPVLHSPPGSETDEPWSAPENSWPVSEPPDELEGEGLDAGQTAPDFLLADQYAQDVSLWQFYGNVIVLDVSTMWCRPCQELAEDAQAIADDYRDDGVMYVTLLAQDLGSDVPDQAELQEWSEGFELYEPILADEAGYSYQVVPDNAFPGVLLIGRDMRVIERIDPASDDTIRAAIDEAI